MKVGHYIKVGVLMPFKVVLLILFSPIIALIYCVFKLFGIKFIFNSYDMRLGHIAEMSCVYDTLHTLGIRYKEIPVYCFHRNVPNRYLTELISKGKIRLYLPFLVYEPIFKIFIFLGVARNIYASSNLITDNFSYKEIQHYLITTYRRNPIFNKIPFDDIIKGQQFLLNTLKLSRDDWYICFLIRTPDYLNGAMIRNTYRNNQVLYDYHSFRDSDINKCIGALKYIASLGGNALRMGTSNEKPFRSNIEGVIDYATNYWSEFNDIIVSMNAKFIISTACGYADMVFHCLGRPVVLINLVYDIGLASVNPSDYNLDTDKAFEELCKIQMTYPKRYYSIEKDRDLTLSEIFSSDLITYYRTEDFVNAGVELIENTEEEITAVTKEMNERLDGTYRVSELEIRLRLKANKILEDNGCPLSMWNIFSGTFLLNHKDIIK